MASEEDDEVCAADALAPIEPLGFAHPLQPREPAIGFAARLAALNGVDLATLLREMRVDALRLDHGREPPISEVAALGRLGDSDTKALISNSPRRLPEERTSLIGPERLPDRSFRRTGFGVCPLCVKDDIARVDGPLPARPWLRREWQLEHVRTCRVHDVVLVDAAVANVRIKPPDFSTALRDRILPELDRLVSSAVPVPHSAFEDWVVARLDGIRDPTNFLDALPLTVGAVFCEALGVSVLHPPMVKIGTLSMLEWAVAAAEGFRIAAAGEDAIMQCLSRLTEARHGRRGVIGLRNTYGYLYEALRYRHFGPDFEVLRAIVRHHAFATIPLEPGTNVLGEVLDRRQVHTVRSAALASGAHPKTIRKLLERNGVSAGDAREYSYHRMTIEAAEIADGLKKLAASVTVPQVSKATGIPRAHLWSLIAQGLLPTLTNSRGVFKAKHLMDPNEVDVLMSRLFDGAEPVGAATERRTTLTRARQRATARVDDILRWLIDGSLRWRGRIGDEMRYENLLIDADELTALVRSEPGMAGLSVRAVAQDIRGFDDASVNALIKMGVFSTREEFNPKSRRTMQTITRESVDAFQKTYILLKELCSTSGLGHLAVRRHLEASGVDLAFSRDDIRAFVYSRKPALAVIRPPSS